MTERPTTERAVTERAVTEPWPPRPKWRPAFAQPLDRLEALFLRCFGGRYDVVIFRHGTCVVVPESLPEAAAKDAAIMILKQIIHAHPDMTPSGIGEGHVMVRYNHPAFSFLLPETALEHREEIGRNHLDALIEGEVLHTPDGPNVFDDFGKAALCARCYLYMDALDPEPARLIRREA